MLIYPVDVGHGSGESLIILLSDPDVPRPSSITGITSLPAHHQRSHDRVSHLELHEKQTLITLYCGDAVYRPESFEHPLDPFSQCVFDSILALDCAYHFKTRHAFLSQSFEHLAPGGRIALADICFSASALQSRWTNTCISFLRLMPKENLISTDDYVRDMKRIGYVDVVMEDISSEVFPGFIKFLKTRNWSFWVLGCVLELYANSGARFVIVSGAKGL